MKTKPFTMVLIIGLYVGGGIVWNDQNSYASEKEVSALAAQVHKVQYTVDRTFLENRLASIESELFNIQQKVEELQRAHKTPDQIYYNRISALTTEKERLQRELADLH